MMSTKYRLHGVEHVLTKGALDSILEKTSDYYEEESDSAVQRLVSLVEPVLLIVMGVIIGMVVIGIYPALYGSLEGLENE
jgi:type IV pilus assembly protein PilC